MSTQRILKYHLHDGQVPTEIKCRFARVLDIQVQHSAVTAWVLTDDSVPEVEIELIPVGTGWEIPSEILDKLEYLKTVQDDYGYVWHYHMKKLANETDNHCPNCGHHVNFGEDSAGYCPICDKEVQPTRG